MSVDFATSIANKLLQFEIAGAATIITGVDASGPHLYMVQNAHSWPADRIGFASIGIGARHANSQLMFRGHTPNKDLPETLLSVYAAKKRADEVAPGVGDDTDMFTIGPRAGSYSPLAPKIQERLAREYGKLREQEKQATEDAEKGMKDYVEEFFRESAEAARAKQEAASEGITEGAGAANEEQVRDDAEERARNRALRTKVIQSLTALANLSHKTQTANNSLNVQTWPVNPDSIAGVQRIELWILQKL